MSPLLPAAPATIEPPGSTINRQFIIEHNGGHHLRDGGAPAPAPETREVTLFHIADVRMTSFGDDGELADIKPDLPDGINYAMWSKTVKPASRDGFADSSEIADLFDD
jgi:hypothetical protein